MANDARIRELKIELAKAEAAGEEREIAKLQAALNKVRGVTAAAEERKESAPKSAPPIGRSSRGERKSEA